MSEYPEMEEAARLRARLKVLDDERAAVVEALDALAAREVAEDRKEVAVSLFPEAPVTATSPTGDKIALFRLQAL